MIVKRMLKYYFDEPVKTDPQETRFAIHRKNKDDSYRTGEDEVNPLKPFQLLLIACFCAPAMLAQQSPAHSHAKSGGSVLSTITPIVERLDPALDQLVSRPACAREDSHWLYLDGRPGLDACRVSSLRRHPQQQHSQVDTGQWNNHLHAAERIQRRCSLRWP